MKIARDHVWRLARMLVWTPTQSKQAHHQAVKLHAAEKTL
jgi:hypothetical protein